MKFLSRMTRLSVVSMVLLLVAKVSQTEATSNAVNSQYQTNILPFELWNVDNSSHDSFLFQMDDMIFSGLQLRHSHYCSLNIYPHHICELFAQSQMWPMPLTYKVGSGFKTEYLNRFTTAIRRIEEHTCVRFQAANVTTDHHVLNIYHVNGSKFNCSSFVGFDSPRQMNLSDKCFDEKERTVEHEMLHALGIVHEQSRVIRDDYVEINWTNIIAKKAYNFNESKVLEDTTPYEYGSIMHYPSVAFNKTPNAETIRPLDPQYYHVMGQRVLVTFNDWKKINSVYCADRCPTPNFCKNGGYRNPNDCSTCVCPTVFQGRTCERITKNPLCVQRSKSLTATEKRRTIILKPLGSHNGTTCVYKISAKLPFGLVNVAVKSDQPIVSKSFTCQDNYVEVRHKNDVTTTGPRYCGGPRMKFASEGRNLYLIIARTSADKSTYQLSYKQTT